MEWGNCVGVPIIKGAHPHGSSDDSTSTT
jgi:hypothetical protein